MHLTRRMFGSRRSWGLVGVSALALTAALSWSQAQAADAASSPQLAAAPSEADATQIEEVVVTARRREEKAQDVPISMTVLGGDALTNTNTYRLEDIATKLPSTNVTVSNPRQNSFAVRGIGNNPANDGLQPSVGVFLDGVYLGRPGMAVFDLTDLEQFELLRGPQGTLFGKNTTAGAVNITTKKPSFTPEANLDVSVGNMNDREFRANVTGPISQNQALRLSVYDTQRDGPLNDVATGKTLDDRDRKGARGQWLVNSGDRLTLRFIAEYGNEGDRQGMTAPYKEINGAGYWKQLAQYKADAAAQGINIQTPYAGHKTYDNDVYANDGQYMKVIQTGVSTIADYDLGGGYNLSSITGVRSWDFYPSNDGDGVSLSIVPAAGWVNHDKQFSQELKVSSPTGGAIDYTTGLFYFAQAQRVHGFTKYGDNITLLRDYLGTVSYDAAGNATFNQAALATATRYAGKTVTTDSDLMTHSVAGFGQANWHATDRLTFTGGLRETYESNEIHLWRNLNGTSTTLPNYSDTSFSKTDSNIGGTLAVDYKLTDNFSPFASYSHGAKAGAMNSTPPTGASLTRNNIVVQPEKVNDFELGFKSQTPDHRGTFNTTGFWTVVQDYQASATVVDPATGKNTSTLQNVGWVASKGVEIDSSYRLFKGFTLGAGGSYDLATYQSYRAGACAAEYKTTAASCDLTGRPVAGAPRWLGNLNGRYEESIAEGWVGYVQAEYTYKSSFFGPWVQDDSSYSKVKPAGLVNLYIGTKLLNDQLDVSLWGRNIFDKRYVMYTAGGTNGAYTAYPGDPMTFGSTLRVKF